MFLEGPINRVKKPNPATIPPCYGRRHGYLGQDRQARGKKPRWAKALRRCRRRRRLGAPDILGRAPLSSDSIGRTSSRGIAPGSAERSFQRSESFEVPRCNHQRHGSINPKQRNSATRTNRSRLGSLGSPLALSESTTFARDTGGVSSLLLEYGNRNLHEATTRRRIPVSARRSLGDLARERRTLRRTSQNHV